MKKVNRERDKIKHQISVLQEQMKDKIGLKDQAIATKLANLYQRLAKIDKQLGGNS